MAASERAATAEALPLKVYWQPGCSSCLRAKEFLTRHGVPFISVNVVADEAGYRELAALGLRQFPIVARGKEWVSGQVLADVARIAGIKYGTPVPLMPDELTRRINIIVPAARRFLGQIPEDQLDTPIPNRPQTYRQLAAHVFQIVEAFLDLVEHDERLEFGAYSLGVPPHIKNREELGAYGAAVLARLNDWWAREGGSFDFSAPADVYYGGQNLHQFFERTTWHSGQHTRQLQTIVEKLGATPDRPLTSSDLAGLPIPDNVWDDKMTII